jgi:ABC-2 type transport system permease protein
LNSAVLKKCLLEARLLFAATAALLFAFCWVRVFIVSRLQMSQFAAIIEQVWDQFKDFSPVPLDQLLSYTGRIAIGYNEPIVVFGISIFAIARGSDAVSGELNRGTLEMLLAQPVSRLQVLYTQALVTLSCLVLLCGLTWLGTTTGIYTTRVKEDPPPPSLRLPGGFKIPLPLRSTEKVLVPMRERTQPRYFLAGAANLLCLGVALAGFSTLVSAFDRYRWRTIGIVVGAYVLMLVLKILGAAIAEVAWLQQLSLFTAYEPQRFISIAAHEPEQNWALLLPATGSGPALLGPLGANLILLTIGALSYLAAGFVFHRRDLPAPL